MTSMDMDVFVELEFRDKLFELGFIERVNTMIECKMCKRFDYPFIGRHFRTYHPELYRMAEMFG